MLRNHARWVDRLLTVIFGRLAKLDPEGFLHAVFVYAGLLPWTFFSSAVGLAGQSLVNQQHLLTRIYFPRLFTPTASIGASPVDMGISAGVYGTILAWYGIFPSWQVVFLPGLLVLTVLAVLGFGYTLAISSSAAVALLVVGLFYFRKTERGFADIA